MSQSIESAIAVTQKAFINGVWPQVAKAIGGGKIIPVENVAEKKFLDTYSGIDHWHVIEVKSVIRGIASRCQWPLRKMFKTFTIRIGRAATEQTELAKRLHAMENVAQGWVRPHLFIQAFFGPPHGSHESFLYAGIAKMDDILKIIRDGQQGKNARDPGDWYEDQTSIKYGHSDAKRFAVVPFETVKRLGCDFTLCENNENNRGH